jgi:hypothetical protein
MDKKKDYLVLCGGTFFTVLLQAARQELLNRQKWGASYEFTEPDVFEALVRIAYPEYVKPDDDDNFKSVVSSFKSCNTGTMFRSNSA